jgi:hypothetical protein
MDIEEHFPSKYLKAVDLTGKDVNVTMADVRVEDLGDDRRPVLYFRGAKKGLVLNRINSRSISDAYGTNTDDWVGHPVILYPTRVDFRGKQTDAIRIRIPGADHLKPAPRRTADDPRTSMAAALSDEIPF